MSGAVEEVGTWWCVRSHTSEQDRDRIVGQDKGRTDKDRKICRDKTRTSLKRLYLKLVHERTHNQFGQDEIFSSSGYLTV